MGYKEKRGGISLMMGEDSSASRIASRMELGDYKVWFVESCPAWADYIKEENFTPTFAHVYRSDFSDSASIHCGYQALLSFFPCEYENISLEEIRRRLGEKDVELRNYENSVDWAKHNFRKVEATFAVLEGCETIKYSSEIRVRVFRDYAELLGLNPFAPNEISIRESGENTVEAVFNFLAEKLPRKEFLPSGKPKPKRRK